MFEPWLDAKGPDSFLHWWNENPIIFGGDRFSDSPGIAVYYIQHSNQTTFELKVEPIQVDRLEFTQSFLERLLKQSNENDIVDIKVKYRDLLLATAVLHVDECRRWALGEGQWFTVAGHPRSWILECG